MGRGSDQEEGSLGEDCSHSSPWSSIPSLPQPGTMPLASAALLQVYDVTFLLSQSPFPTLSCKVTGCRDILQGKLWREELEPFDLKKGTLGKKQKQKHYSKISDKGADAVCVTPAGGSGASEPSFWGVHSGCSRNRMEIPVLPLNSEITPLQVASPRAGVGEPPHKEQSTS